MENLEKVESQIANSAVLENYSKPDTAIVIEQPSGGQQQTMAMDVYGQQIEPICNYRTCNYQYMAIVGHANAIL
jgi:hypothetical protein